MGDWEASGDRVVLERIVALLFALAGLADLAACLPFRHRWQVLDLLSHGEAEARAFLIGVSTGVPVLADASAEDCDAARLAARFRALALLLCAMLACRFAVSGAGGSQAGRLPHGISRPTVFRLAGSPAPDTS
jgi:hypothetical protein